MVIFSRLVNINVIENLHHVFVAEGEREGKGERHMQFLEEILLGKISLRIQGYVGGAHVFSWWHIGRELALHSYIT